MSPYRGRFAPTPSGPLHLGSLLTALASYLQARSQKGQWLLRIDDLDTPRNLPGADTTILQQLEAHGFEWDEPVRRQSQHLPEYVLALARLQHEQRLYACDCTRAELQRWSQPGPDGPVYAGRCRTRHLAFAEHALRLRTDDGLLSLDDAWQGLQQRRLDRDVGDFTVRRNDGQIAYQLACVVDDAAQDITEVVRGADLLGSTFRQIRLQQCLSLPSPAYRHLPVLTHPEGLKLSKQNHATSLSQTSASRNLMRCLCWLHQSPPADLGSAPVHEIQAWAVRHWRPDTVPRKMAIAVE